MTASLALRTFLGEYRMHGDVEMAAVVAEMSVERALQHVAADSRGEYADVAVIEPTWRIDFGTDALLPRPPANDQ